MICPGVPSVPSMICPAVPYVPFVICPGFFVTLSSALVYPLFHHLPWCTHCFIICPGGLSSVPVSSLVYLLSWCLFCSIICPGVIYDLSSVAAPSVLIFTSFSLLSLADVHTTFSIICPYVSSVLVSPLFSLPLYHWSHCT